MSSCDPSKSVDAIPNAPSNVGSIGSFFLSLLDEGYAEDEARRPNPKSFPFFGGSGGGGDSSIEFETPVSVPRLGNRGFPLDRLRS